MKPSDVLRDLIKAKKNKIGDTKEQNGKTLVWKKTPSGYDWRVLKKEDVKTKSGEKPKVVEKFDKLYSDMLEVEDRVSSGAAIYREERKELQTKYKKIVNSINKLIPKISEEVFEEHLESDLSYGYEDFLDGFDNELNF